MSLSNVTIIYICGTLRIPNPVKIIVAAEELGITYKLIHKDFGDGPNGVKTPEFLKINPNGRVPALVDHTNGDYIVWESGAILLYLIDPFDKEKKLYATDLTERTEINTWLFFINSGQNVMTEQSVYWKHSHPVKDIHESVYERYRSETYRIWDVLEKQLAEQGDFICVHRFTIVDCSVGPYWDVVTELAGLELSADKYPNLDRYMKQFNELPAVKRAYEKIKAATSA